MFRRDQIQRPLSRLEGLDVCNIDLCYTQALCRFNLIPVKDFNRKVSTNSGRLHSGVILLMLDDEIVTYHLNGKVLIPFGI
jgi:hypothetical protein